MREKKLDAARISIHLDRMYVHNVHILLDIYISVWINIYFMLGYFFVNWYSPKNITIV
jgi:hypothetical protein